MEKEKELYEVFTLRLMNYLVQHGFYVKSVKDDIVNPHFKVFLFDKTNELISAVANYRKR